MNEEIAVADVSRLREQRRLAITDAERTALRARLLQVARAMEEAPAGSAGLNVLLGVATIAASLVLGALLFGMADSMWGWLNS